MIRRQVLSAEAPGFVRSDHRWMHFGLSAELSTYLEIRWPSAKPDQTAHVAENKLIVIREDSEIVRRESFSAASRVGSG